MTPLTGPPKLQDLWKTWCKTLSELCLACSCMHSGHLTELTLTAAASAGSTAAGLACRRLCQHCPPQTP